MSGAATNPDPDVFAYAAAQVKNCIDVTKRLKGENYVLWGGREGYETLLNTDLGRESEQAGRFLSLVRSDRDALPVAELDQAEVGVDVLDRPTLGRARACRSARTGRRPCAA